jgi:hypothetical protein
MPRVTSRSWTEQQIEQLRDLVRKGASASRASVALKRSKASVQNKAREIGAPFATERERRQQVRAASLRRPTAGASKFWPRAG